MMKAFIVCDDHQLTSRLSAAIERFESGWQIASPHTELVDTLQLESVGRSQCAVFMRVPDNLEDAVRAVRILRRTGPSTIIAVGRNLGPQEILEMLRSGADDFIAIGPDLENELQTALQRMRSDTDENGKHSKLISIVGCGGGTGAGFVSVNLAAAISKLTKSCALLDLILSGGDHALQLKLSPRHSIIDLVSKVQQLDRAMFNQSLVRHDSGVHLLAAPEPFRDLREVSAKALQQVISIARARFPAVVVELENLHHHEQVRILAESNYVVLVMRLDFTSLVRTHNLLAFLESNQINRERIRIVANRQGLPMELSSKKVQSILGVPLSHCIPDDSSAVCKSVNLGQPLVLNSPGSKAAKGIELLAKEFLNRENNIRSVLNRPHRPWLHAASVLAGFLPTLKQS